MEDMGQTLSHQALKQIAYDMWGEEDLESLNATSVHHTAHVGALRVVRSVLNLPCIVGRWTNKKKKNLKNRIKDGLPLKH